MIDAHVHYMRPEWVDALWTDALRRSSAYWPKLSLRLSTLADPAALVAALDARRCAGAIVYPELSIAPGPQIPGGPAAALALARAMNDATAALVARRRDRLTGLAVINPFGADADLAELRRAVVGLGLRGVAVGASYRGQPLDAPAARPYLAQVETLGIPLVIHPTVDGAVTTARDFGLDLLLGVPADLALCAIRLIVSGRLAEFPRLCVVLAHAGGGFLSLLGWLDAHAATESLRPLEQAKRFYVDLATASAGDLALALSIVGPDHILYATDWPIAPPVAPGDPQRDIAALPLSLDERGAILAGNARRLFG